MATADSGDVLPHLRTEAIRAVVGPTSADRGFAVAASGAVGRLRYDAATGRLSASVQGTAPSPYRVQVQLQEAYDDAAEDGRGCGGGPHDRRDGAAWRRAVGVEHRQREVGLESVAVAPATEAFQRRDDRVSHFARASSLALVTVGAEVVGDVLALANDIGHSAFNALAHTVLSRNARTLDDLVAEMGAMRFPPSSTTLQHYLDLAADLADHQVEHA